MSEPKRLGLLPPSMGFEREEWHNNQNKHGPHYTCIANGRRITVWVDIDPSGDWHLQLASASYETASAWRDRTVYDTINVPIGEALLLQAAIHELTSRAWWGEKESTSNNTRIG